MWDKDKSGISSCRSPGLAGVSAIHHMKAGWWTLCHPSSLLRSLARGAEWARAEPCGTWVLQWGSPPGCCTSSHCWRSRKERSVPAGVHLGITKASQQGTPSAKLLEQPGKEEAVPLHPKVSCVAVRHPAPPKCWRQQSHLLMGVWAGYPHLCWGAHSSRSWMIPCPCEPSPRTPTQTHSAPMCPPGSGQLSSGCWGCQLQYHLRHMPKRALPPLTLATKGGHQTWQGCKVQNDFIFNMLSLGGEKIVLRSCAKTEEMHAMLCKEGLTLGLDHFNKQQ